VLKKDTDRESVFLRERDSKRKWVCVCERERKCGDGVMKGRSSQKDVHTVIPRYKPQSLEPQPLEP